MGEQMEVCMNRWKYGCADGRMDQQMEVWASRWKYGSADGKVRVSRWKGMGEQMEIMSEQMQVLVSRWRYRLEDGMCEQMEIQRTGGSMSQQMEVCGYSVGLDLKHL